MSPAESTTDTDTNPLVGSTINERYDLLACIDAVGNSRVYKVKDRRDSLIKAMKVFRGFSPEHLDRFLHEAERVKNQIKHPGLVQLHDFGVVHDHIEFTGAAFIVMDYVSGRSLYSILNRQGRVELAQALNIFIQVCEVSRHLHAADVPNIQLSPRKIMISDGGDQVRLTDPGLSAILSTLEIEPDSNTTHFPEGILYLSPEQCTGQPGDHRSDVYALGCIMYESLVGLPPFLSKSPYEVSRMQINEEPKPLRMSRDDLNFPLELDLLVLKSLRKNPNHRQQNITELLEDLQHAHKELSKIPEMARAEQLRSHNFISDMLEDLSDLIGIDSTLKLKLALPIVLGAILILGSSALGYYLLNIQSLKQDPSTAADKEWQQLTAEGKGQFEHKKYDSAERSYNRALLIAEKFGKNDPRFLTTLTDLRNVYVQENRSDKIDEVEERLKTIMAEGSDPQNHN